MAFDANWLEDIKECGREVGRIGYVCSCWDLLHAGHCLLLEEAKSRCDYLVVGLHRDPSLDRPWKNKPIMSLKERFILLESNRHVDDIIEYDDENDHAMILRTLQPDIRFLGSDYLKQDRFTGDDLDIPVYFHDRDKHGWSSSELRRRVYEQERRIREKAEEEQQSLQGIRSEQSTTT